MELKDTLIEPEVTPETPRTGFIKPSKAAMKLKL